MRYHVPRRPSIGALPREAHDDDWIPDDEDEVPPLPSLPPQTPRTPRSASVPSDRAAMRSLSAFLRDDSDDRPPLRSPPQSPPSALVARQASGQQSTRELADFFRDEPTPITGKLKTILGSATITDDRLTGSSEEGSPPKLARSPRSPITPRSASIEHTSSRDLAAFLRDEEPERPPPLLRHSSSTVRTTTGLSRVDSADSGRTSVGHVNSRRLPVSAPVTPRQADRRFDDLPSLPSPTSPKIMARSASREPDNSRDLADFLADKPAEPRTMSSAEARRQRSSGSASALSRVRTDASERPTSSGSQLSAISQERSASRASTMTWTTMSDEPSSSAQHSDTPLLADEPAAVEDEGAIKKSRRRSMIDAIKSHVPRPFESHTPEPSTSAAPEPSTSQQPEPAPAAPAQPAPRRPPLQSPLLDKRSADPAAAHALDDHSAGAVLQAVAAQNGLNVNATTTQITPDTHPANAQAPLEYVKLCVRATRRNLTPSERARRALG